MNTQYKDDIRSVYSPMSKADQAVLYTAIQEGDENARSQVIYSCLPLVYDLAKKFQNNNKHVDIEDMIQHGNMALIRAVDNWDISKASITTVATYYIRNALIDMIKDNRYNIKSKYDMTRQAAEDINKIKTSGVTEPEEIKEATGLTDKRIKLLLRIMSGKRVDLSLLNPRLHNKDEHETSGDTNIKGCLADLISLLEECVESEKDRKIFLTWIDFLNRNNKTRLVAQEVSCTLDEVSESIRKTKKTLRRIFRERELAYCH